MEIFGVEFESWNVVLFSLNWFAIVLLLVIIIVISWIFSAVNNRINRKSITINEISLGIGDSSVKLTYNKKDQETWVCTAQKSGFSPPKSKKSQKNDDSMQRNRLFIRLIS